MTDGFGGARLDWMSCGGQDSYVHMMLSMPPRYVVSQVTGLIKGKSANHLVRVFGEHKRNSVASLRTVER